jgi:hypothetical protein
MPISRLELSVRIPSEQSHSQFQSQLRNQLLQASLGFDPFPGSHSEYLGGQEVGLARGEYPAKDSGLTIPTTIHSLNSVEFYNIVNSRPETCTSCSRRDSSQCIGRALSLPHHLCIIWRFCCALRYATASTPLKTQLVAQVQA